MTEIQFDDCVSELLTTLEKNKIWVLSTSKDDLVTSRNMSLVNIGTDIYFQTHVNYVKHSQMLANCNVALCKDNCSIEGKAECIGNWNDVGDPEILKEYKRVHKDSYERYGRLEGQVVYRVSPRRVKFWEYRDGMPIRKEIRVSEKKAYELDYLLGP